MIYDAFGKLVAEYGDAEVGFGGVKYVQQDHQGSVRTLTNENGFVVSRTDHQSYGETIGTGVGLRSTLQGYRGTVSTRQGYGLTEGDNFDIIISHAVVVLLVHSVLNESIRARFICF